VLDPLASGAESDTQAASLRVGGFFGVPSMFHSLEVKILFTTVGRSNLPREICGALRNRD
jgi:hypothetical protein